MKLKKYDATGKESGTIEVPDALFGSQVSAGAIHSVIRIENNNRRQGTHKTKGFSDVTGGGRKPYRQKGTGNARQGSIRAPQFRKGATVFGPLPRDYTINIPEKMRKAGIRSIISKKAKDNAVCVISDLKLDKISTKSAYQIFKNMGVVPGNTASFVLGNEDAGVLKSVRNIAQIYTMNAKRILAPELYHSGQIVISESALEFLVKNYSKTVRKVAGV